MRKSTLFVSAALTTFMLVMLFGVVTAYQAVSAQAVTNTNPANVSSSSGRSATTCFVLWNLRRH